MNYEALGCGTRRRVGGGREIGHVHDSATDAQTCLAMADQPENRQAAIDRFLGGRNYYY